MARLAHTVAVTALVAATSGLSTDARAQQVNAQRLRPAIDAWRFQVAEDPAVPGPGAAGVSVLMHHAQRPLSLTVSDTLRRDLLGGVTSASVLAYVGASHRFRFGVELPLHIALRGEDETTPFALGDLRLSGKLRVLPASVAPWVDLAVLLDVETPSGNGALWVGERWPVVWGRLTTRFDPLPVLSVVANLGVASGTGERFGTFRHRARLTYAAGLSVAPSPDLAISAELDGAWWMGDRTPARAPAELIVSLRGRPLEHLVITAGGSAGLTSGFATPSWRILLGVGWTPGAVPPPRPELPR